jgi:hypothetical protein
MTYQEVLEAAPWITDGGEQWAFHAPHLFLSFSRPTGRRYVMRYRLHEGELTEQTQLPEAQIPDDLDWKPVAAP